MADRIADPWGERTPYRAGEGWPERVDELLADGISKQVRRIEREAGVREQL